MRALLLRGDHAAFNASVLCRNPQALFGIPRWSVSRTSVSFWCYDNLDVSDKLERRKV